jgi:hypothetical protein
MAAVFALALAVPASAAGGEPQITDECGVGDHTAFEIVAPWNDLCSGQFSTLSAAGEPTVLAIALEVAGDAEQRTLSDYQVRWLSGACTYRIRSSDGPGELRQSPIVVAVPTTVYFSATCGESVPRPCELTDFATQCYDHPPTTHVALDPDVFVTEGSTLTWTLAFDGPLAPFAADHADGRRLTGLHASSHGPIGAGFSYCVSGFCGAVVADFARGDSYTIGT